MQKEQNNSEIKELRDLACINAGKKLREFREESYMDLDSLNAKLIGTCKFNLFVFKWSTFLYIVDESFSPPTRFCSEFSEFRFIKLTEIKNYKLGFGVKKEIRDFLKPVNN